MVDYTTTGIAGQPSISFNPADSTSMAMHIEVYRAWIDEWRANAEKEGYGTVIDISFTIDGVGYALTLDQLVAALQPFATGERWGQGVGQGIRFSKSEAEG